MKLTKRNNLYVVDNPKLSLVNEMELENGGALEVVLKLVDKRNISTEQRNLIFALCGEIADYTGQNDKEYWRLVMQQYNANLRGIEVESLSNCSVTYARELTETIVNFCIEKNIPIARETLEKGKYTFDEKQVYVMCLKRICVVCGRLGADLHHTNKAVGMGRNRQKISHIGMEMLPLCRVHHNEAHTRGDKTFIERYHLEPIKVDKKLEHFIKKGSLKTWKE